MVLLTACAQQEDESHRAYAKHPSLQNAPDIRVVLLHEEMVKHNSKFKPLE